MMIAFTVWGEPTPKGRPKFCRQGAFVRAITPTKTRNAEQDFLTQAISKKPSEPLTGPIAVQFDVYRAKGIPKTKKGGVDAERGLVRPVTKPDLDNYIKILDALNGIFWKDDGQIVQIIARKFYSSRPRVEVVIDELSAGK